MNRPLKIALRTASTGLLVYLLYLIVRSMLPISSIKFSSMVVLSTGFNALLMFSIALACLALFVHRDCMFVPDKCLRVLVYTTAVIAVLFICMGSYRIATILGHPYLYMEAWQQCILLGLVIGILWKLSSMDYMNASYPRSFSVALLVSGLLPCIVLVLMLVSGIHVLFTGHVIGTGLGTGRYISWLKGLIPAVLLPWYAVLIRRSTCK